MDWVLAGEIAKAFSAVAGAFILAWTGIKHVWPFVKRAVVSIKCFWNRTKGIIFSLEGLPAMLGRMNEMASSIATTKGLAIDIRTHGDERGRQLAEHGARIDGMSAMIGSVAAEVTSQREQFVRIDKRVESIANSQRAFMQINPHMAVLEAGSDGMVKAANRVFLKWTGMQRDDVERFGWLDAVHREDRASLRADLVQAFADYHRLDGRKFRMCGPDGKVFEVSCNVDPIPEGSAPCDSWFITFTKTQTELN